MTLSKEQMKEMGEALGFETLNASKMFMDINEKDQMERQYWSFMHIGFVTGLKCMGVSEEQAIETVTVAQDFIRKNVGDGDTA